VFLSQQKKDNSSLQIQFQIPEILVSTVAREGVEIVTPLNKIFTYRTESADFIVMNPILSFEP
jgi:hypothetical protein